jgi:TPR repeat protein
MALKILAIAVGLMLWIGPVHAERRAALIIGNAAYEHAPSLRTPVPDARAVADTLRHLDFDVLLGTDLDKIGMERLIERFVQSLPGTDVALVYYSGHAVQVDNQNHLIPISARIRSSAELSLETVPLEALFAYMRQNAKVQLIFLDACRNNPFAEQIVTPSRQDNAKAVGLAQVSTTGGALVAFSTEPGKVAFDGMGQLSPFTGSFVNRAREPRVEIRQALTRVRGDVIAATGGEQVPWDNSALLSEFYFIPPKPQPVFDKLAFVRARRAPDEAAVPLGLVAARQPEGGEVRVNIETAPRQGVLELDGRTLAAGGAFTGADLARLAYRPEDQGRAVADAFSFNIRDDFGNQGTGFVTVALEAAADEVAVASRPTPSLDLGRVVASATSTLGLGPNLKVAGPSLVAGDNAGQSWVRLITAPSGGLLKIGDRPLDRGRSMTLAELPKLAFLPSIGSNGQVSDAVFQVEAPNAGEIRLRIQVDIDACDRLAAFQFDTQGVVEGVPVEQLDARAALAACEAAVRDHPDVARFHSQLGRAYLALRRNADALRAFEQAASLGHRRASAVLGGFYLLGTLVPQDPARARSLYQQAADMGDVAAAKALGQMYYDGRGVTQDFARARELFEKGAHVGYTESMNSLGRLYSLGEGVTRDAAVARHFWEASAERGDIYGINNLGFVYLNGTDVAADPSRALTLFQRAAKLGHPQAPNNVGNILVRGKGVRANLDEAARWYRIGADRGDAWAAVNLGNMYRTGRGARLDLVAAARFYARGAGLPQLEPAKLGREAVTLLNTDTKLRALRSLLKSLESNRDAVADGNVLARATDLVAQRGPVQNTQDLDEVLIAVAKAEWLALAPRLDSL